MAQRLRPSPELRQRIIESGCYGNAENTRIYEKWFSSGPRYQFQAVDRKYGLADKVICDIGCGYGMNLVYAQPGSYGIEVDRYAADFARSIGLTIEERDFLHESVDDLPKVDAVWCSAVLEHVESVHLFLRKMALILKPDGLVAIFVPTIPLIPQLKHVPKLSRFTSGHLYSDHINAFTPSTLRFFCERAGFETLDVSPFMPSVFGFANHIPLLNRLVDGVTYVGCKVPDWEYPQGATRTATSTGSGFAYRSWFEDGARRGE